MVERLNDEERKFISNNWEGIKKAILEQPNIKISENDLTIEAEREDNDKIKLTITNKDNGDTQIMASLNSKMIKFKYQEDKNQIEKDELIYESSSIKYFISKYNMEHPIFIKTENGKIINKSFTDEIAEEIFYDPEINEIIDDHFDSNISKKEFIKFKRNQKSLSDYYDEYSVKFYSNIAKIINDKSNEMILKSEGRQQFKNFLGTIGMKKEKIIILGAAQKIGISFSILQIMKCYSILYIDLNTIFNLKNSDKRKYIFTRFMNLFKNYEKYNTFITENILKLQGYSNILSIIEDIIKKIINEFTNLIVIIDNYDDYLVGEKKLSSDYLDKLYEIIRYNSVKLIFIGKGNYISTLLLDYFYNRGNIKYYILFNYYNTLELNIENIIHSYYKENNINEIDLYYNRRFKDNMEMIILNLIMIKNLKNINLENFQGEFPFQFFHFNKDKNKKLNIEEQFKDLIDLNNIKLREYISKINTNINKIYNKSSPPAKGFIFEELVVSILMNNKSSLKNLKFSRNNIIEVESIYNLKDVNLIQNLENGPILIIQKTNGEVFDFGILINNNGINCFVGGQIGLNKQSSEIRAYLDKISSSHNNIINNLKILTGRPITELKFLIILNKDWQDNLKKEFEEKDQKIIDYKKNRENKTLNQFEEDEIKKMTKDISYYNTQFGIKCCENLNVSYLLFSDKDYSFYNENKIIELFDAKEIKSIKTGFEMFCTKEYNLIPYSLHDSILTDKEKSLFVEKLKKDIYSDIIDIKINYKLDGKINILSATPENYGIISIYNDNTKIFTYYDGSFIIFVFKNDKIIKYEDIKIFINFEYEYAQCLEKYFVEFIYEGENSGININEEKDKNINIKKEITGKQRKEEQKKESFINHLKYLGIKRKHINKN